MSTPHKDPRAVIEQLVTALGKLLGPENYEPEDLVNAWTALTAGREALEQPEHAVPFAWARPGAVDSSQDFRFIKIDDFTVPLYDHPQASEPAPSTPLSLFVNSSPSDREVIGNAAVAKADAEIAKMTAPSTQPERMPLTASAPRSLPSCP